MRDLKAWLRDTVFPLWAEKGVDRAGGGFYEALDANAEPLPVDRRFRVASRQTYAFITAGRLGWDGPAAAPPLSRTGALAPFAFWTRP